MTDRPDSELLQDTVALGRPRSGGSGAVETASVEAASVETASAVPSEAAAETAPLTHGESPTLPPPASELPPWVPERIGPYELRRQIGKGGMGLVFLADQLRPVERPVAVKLIRSGLLNREALGRFEAEREALARMRHPHIAQIFDAGNLDGRLPYLVMEYVEGEPITRYCRQHGLGLRARLRLFLGVCSAIQHAHRRGILHRDVKPNNVLVTGQGTEARAKVIDFGVAKAFGAGDRDTRLTLPGYCVGTPAYMSPEQTWSVDAEVDTRADVYALGALLYELATDEAVFDLDRIAESDTRELLRILREDEPQRPSQRLERRLRALGPLDAAARERLDMLRTDLDWILLKALDKDPDRRYGSPDELAADLRRVLDGEPVRARRPTLAYRLRKKLHKHRRALPLASAALMLVTASGVWGLGSWLASGERQRLAQLTGREVERLEALVRYAHMQPLHDVRAEYAVVRRRLEEVEARLEQQGRAARGPAAYAVGRGYLALGELEPARRHLERAWQLGERGPEVAFALGRTLGRLYQEGLDEAAALRDEALRLRRRQELATTLRDPAVRFLEAGLGDDPQLAGYVRGLIAFYAGDLDFALLHAGTLAEDRPWFYEPLLLAADLEARRADELADQGDYAACLAAHDRAIAGYRQAALLGPSDPLVLTRLCDLQLDRLAMLDEEVAGAPPDADYDKALEDCQRATRVHPGRAEAFVQASRGYRLLGARLGDQDQDPEDAFRQALALADQAVALAPEDGSVHQARGQLLARHAFYLMDRWDSPVDPRPLYEQAVASLERALELGENGPNLYTTLGNAHGDLGLWLLRRGEDAQEAMETSVAVLRQGAELWPESASLYLNLGVSHNELGQYESRRTTETGDVAAEAHFAAASEAYRRSLELNPNQRMVLSNLANNLRSQATVRGRRGEDPSPLLREAIATAEPLLDDREWSTPWINHGGAYVQLAEAEMAAGGDPRPALARGRVSLLHAVEIAGTTRPWLYASTAASHLLEVRYLLLRGESPAAALDAARRWVETAVTRAPEDPYSRYVQALVEFQTGRWRSLEGRDFRPAFAAARRFFVESLKDPEGDPAETLDLAELELFAAQAEISEPGTFRAGLDRGRAALEEARRRGICKSRCRGLEAAFLFLEAGGERDAGRRQERLRQGRALLDEAIAAAPRLVSPELRSFRPAEPL